MEIGDENRIATGRKMGSEKLLNVTLNSTQNTKATEPQEDQKEGGKTRLNSRLKRQQEKYMKNNNTWIKVAKNSGKMDNVGKRICKDSRRQILWTMCYAEKTHHKIQSDQHDALNGVNFGRRPSGQHHIV